MTSISFTNAMSTRIPECQPMQAVRDANQPGPPILRSRPVFSDYR